jgi:hypothetical protein
MSVVMPAIIYACRVATEVLCRAGVPKPRPADVNRDVWRLKFGAEQGFQSRGPPM